MTELRACWAIATVQRKTLEHVNTMHRYVYSRESASSSSVFLFKCVHYIHHYFRLTPYNLPRVYSMIPWVWRKYLANAFLASEIDLKITFQIFIHFSVIIRVQCETNENRAPEFGRTAMNPQNTLALIQKQFYLIRWNNLNIMEQCHFVAIEISGIIRWISIKSDSESACFNSVKPSK